MTISDAVKKYQEQGEGSVSAAFREAVNHLIDGDIKTEFKNDSYLDALYLTDVMFHRASNSIRILTGPGADGFLAALKESFLNVIRKLSLCKGDEPKIKILLMSKELPTWLADLEEKYPNTLRIFRAESREPTRHFIVCDSSMTRHEDIHGPLTPDSPASAINAQVSFNDPNKAQVLEQVFELMWKAVSHYQLNLRHL